MKICAHNRDENKTFPSCLVFFYSSEGKETAKILYTINEQHKGHRGEDAARKTGQRNGTLTDQETC